jgi:hypothetical protein
VYVKPDDCVSLQAVAQALKDDGKACHALWLARPAGASFKEPQPWLSDELKLSVPLSVPIALWQYAIAKGFTPTENFDRSIVHPKSDILTYLPQL